MNTPTEDEGLRDRLRQWEVRAPLPARFRENVWRGIARAEASNPPSAEWMRRLTVWVAAFLRKPVGAAAYISILLAAGIVIAIWRSDQYASRMEAAWRIAYLQAVTPPASGPPPP